VCKKTIVVAGKLGGKFIGFWIFGYEFLFTSARTSPFGMSFSMRPDMS
jgi:hypothetical protein